MLIHAKEIKKGVEQLQGTGTSCERRKGSAATCEELETLLRKSHVPVEFDNWHFWLGRGSVSRLMFSDQRNHGFHKCVPVCPSSDPIEPD